LGRSLRHLPGQTFEQAVVDQHPGVDLQRLGPLLAPGLEGRHALVHRRVLLLARRARIDRQALGGDRQPGGDRRQQLLAEALHQLGEESFYRRQFLQGFRRLARHLQQLCPAQHLEGGTVTPLGLGLAPLQQLFENRQLPPVEGAGALGAQEQGAVIVGEADLLQQGELLRHPLQPSFFPQTPFQQLRQTVQMAGILRRVADHFAGEGALRPVGALKLFVEGDAEILAEDVGQPDLLLAEKLAGDHGVEEPAHLEAEIPVQAADVVIGGMEELANGGIGQHRRQRREVADRQGIDE